MLKSTEIEKAQLMPLNAPSNLKKGVVDEENNQDINSATYERSILSLFTLSILFCCFTLYAQDSIITRKAMMCYWRRPFY